MGGRGEVSRYSPAAPRSLGGRRGYSLRSYGDLAALEGSSVLRCGHQTRLLSNFFKTTTSIIILFCLQLKTAGVLNVSLCISSELR